MSLLNAASTFKLSNPAAAIAALPALLGFTPRQSLAMLTITGGELICVLRMDLSDALVGNAAAVAESAARTGADAIIAIVVDEDGAACDMCSDEHCELTTALRSALRARSIELLAAHVVDRVEAGGRWHCAAGCGEGGVIDDPNLSPVMATAVLTGRIVHTSRDDIAKLFEIDDPARTARLATQLSDQQRELAEAEITTELTAALAILNTFTETTTLADSDAVRLAVALTDHRLRDSLMGLGVGAKARQALELWTRLSQLLPDTHRPEALTMAAITSYMIGDGPIAGIALAAALLTKPNHRLAGMIDTALTSGLPPARVRELGMTGARLARRFEVEL